MASRLGTRASAAASAMLRSLPSLQSRALSAAAPSLPLLPLAGPAALAPALAGRPERSAAGLQAAIGLSWRSPAAAPAHSGLGRASRRGFRSTTVAAAGADQGLVKALESELQHETSTYEAPEELAQGPPGGFRVESSPGAAELVLRSAFKGEDIAVLVSAAPEDAEYDEEDDYEDVEEGQGESEESEEVDEEEVDEPYLPVRVSITKTGKDGNVQVLELDCGIEADNSWVIEGVSLEDPHVADESIAYTGPDFLTLDPALQEQFQEYLERRGFTPELAGFIRASLEDKEQKEYVSWLGRVKEFVAL